MNFVRRLGFLLAAAAGCSGADQAIVLEGARFRVTGLAPSEIAAAGEAEWPRLLAVRVARAETPLFGSYRVEEGDLVFEPRFPLQPGLEYRAVFDPSILHSTTARRMERSFSIPAAPAGAPTVLEHIYPSAAKVPENLLKFYLYFSAPMARGEAYRHLHLVESGGKEVELPFLELGEELWDRSGKRLTLFFDPGRIKRGLKPREDAGPSLEEGKSYTLVIDRDWRDAEGRPLKSDARKSFSAGPPDDAQPDPAKWKVAAPRAGSSEPLRVSFEKPMDQGMLGRVLAVLDAKGQAVDGRIEVDQDETRWSFHPQSPWSAGKFALAADTVMEDLAGNSIARPFEIDVFRPVERSIGVKILQISFQVAP